MDATSLPAWAQGAGALAIVVASVITAIYGFIKKPAVEHIKVEGREIDGAGESLRRIADSLERIAQEVATFNHDAMAREMAELRLQLAQAQTKPAPRRRKTTTRPKT